MFKWWLLVVGAKTFIIALFIVAIGATAAAVPFTDILDGRVRAPNPTQTWLLIAAAACAALYSMLQIIAQHWLFKEEMHDVRWRLGQLEERLTRDAYIVIDGDRAVGVVNQIFELQAARTDLEKKRAQVPPMDEASWQKYGSKMSYGDWLDVMNAQKDQEMEALRHRVKQERDDLKEDFTTLRVRIWRGAADE